MNDHPSRGFTLNNPTVSANVVQPAVDYANPGAAVLAPQPGPGLLAAAADAVADAVAAQSNAPSTLPTNSAPATAREIKPFGTVAIVVAMVALLVFVLWRK
jgi:hypothetical protein